MNRTLPFLSMENKKVPCGTSSGTEEWPHSVATVLYLELCLYQIYTWSPCCCLFEVTQSAGWDYAQIC